MQKSITAEHKERIRVAIKNKQDISGLISGYDIRNLDLSYAIISQIDVSNQDISNVNFSYAIIGMGSQIVHFNSVLANNCNFCGTMFNSNVMMRRGTFNSCNFNNAFLPYADYKFARFTNCNFCDMVFRIGADSGIGAVFDSSFFGALDKYWNVKIVSKSYDEQYKSMED